MATLENIIALVNAGYTKDEIAAMAGGPVEIAPSPIDPAPAPAPAAGPETAPAPAPAPTPAPTPAPAPADPSGALASVLAQMQATLAGIQAANIRNSAGPGPVQPEDIDRLAVDQLAKVIMPTYKQQ